MEDSSIRDDKSSLQSFKFVFHSYLGFPDSSVVMNPPAMQETPVQFLCQEDLLEKG